MTIKRFEVPRPATGQRLDVFLATTLEGALSRREIRRIIARGGVSIDGKRVKLQSRALRMGQEIRVSFEKPGDERREDSWEPQILFQDRFLLAVDKPSGLPTQATRGDHSDHLFAAARDWLGRQAPPARAGQEPPYLALHHRLDRGTSGVVLLSKSRRANRGLARAFSGGGVEKTYLALVFDPEGRLPPEPWTVRNRLEEVSSRGRKIAMAVAGSEAPSEDLPGRPAETRFRRLQSVNDMALVEASPRTGRMHQLRVHLADCGFPVLGDRLYGAGTGASGEGGGRPRQRLMLHAAVLALEHPVTGEPLRIESPLPEAFRSFLGANGPADPTREDA